MEMEMDLDAQKVEDTTASEQASRMTAISDLDIACLQVALNGHWGGSAAQSAPRPWLSAEDNVALAACARDVHAGMNDALQELSDHALSGSDARRDSARWSNWLLRSAHALADTAASRTCPQGPSTESNTPDRSTDSADADCFGRSNVAQTLHRDVDRVHRQLLDSIDHIRSLDDADKQAMLRWLTIKLDRVSDVETSNRPPRFPPSSEPDAPSTVGARETLGSEALSWLKSKAPMALRVQKDLNAIGKVCRQARSFVDRFVGLDQVPTDAAAEVDNRRLQIATRFGLDGVTIACAAWFSPRQQLRWLDRIEDALGEACWRMGISEVSFGAGARTGLQIEPPEFASAKGFTGSLIALRPNHTVMSINAADPSPANVLLHEFTHQLDLFLGTRAREKDPELFAQHDFPPRVQGANGKHLRPPVWHRFYSELTPRQMDLLPEARHALGEVASCLQENKPAWRLWGKSPFVGAPHAASGTIRGEEMPHVLQPLVQKHLDDVLLRAFERFAMVHLGPQAFLNMSSNELQDYRNSLHSEGKDLLYQTAWQMGTRSLDNLADDLSERQMPQQDSTPSLPAFVVHAQALHGDDEARTRRAALNAIQADLVELGAHLHPMMSLSRSDLGAGVSKPSSMLIESIRKDVALSSSGSNRYFSRPAELLARLIERPQNQTELLTARAQGDQAHTGMLSKAQLARLNRGMAGLLDAAGIERVAEPRLSSDRDRALHRAAEWDSLKALVKQRIVEVGISGVKSVNDIAGAVAPFMSADQTNHNPDRAMVRSGLANRIKTLVLPTSARAESPKARHPR